LRDAHYERNIMVTETEERLRRQSDLRESQEAVAEACHIEELARDTASDALEYYEETIAERKMWQRVRNRLEEAVLVVGILLLLLLSGCGTGRAFGGLLKGIGDDTITLFNGVENEIQNQK
jgi:hypothetical protein